MSLTQLIFSKNKLRRTIFFLFCDTFLISFSVWMAFMLRFDGVIPDRYDGIFERYLTLTVIIVISLFFLRNLYSISWSFISILELVSLLLAVVISFVIIGSIISVFKESPAFEGFPRSIIFITAFLVLIFTGGLRFAKRIYLQGFVKNSFIGRKVLIFGAGEAGEQLVRSILSSPKLNYSIVGMIDDNPMKYKITIHGVKVIGRRQDIPDIIKKFKVEELIIAAPNAPAEIIREAANLARQAALKQIKILPSTKDILEEKISLNNIRDISIADLLGREPIYLETEAISRLIQRKRILITGAAGSIGSHLCEQMIKFNPAEIICVDFDETGTFYLDHKLRNQNQQVMKKFIIANICQDEELEKIFIDHNPEIVFHAAAYKHVPLMEDHPHKAIENNIFGVKLISEKAIKHGVEKFIFISTDKAVNPSSVMGMSKRIGEFICQSSNQLNHTKFISVRFGNVLDSRGNVISLFKNQIKKGGPVEVTHPDMTRYFMVTSEAVLLVMQAGAMGLGGEVFVLDMGNPVKIVDLARDLITLSGFIPDKDIPIVFTNPRPGEKLFENILTAEEGTKSTRHEKILEAKLPMINPNKLQITLDSLKNDLKIHDKNKLKMILNQIVNDFQSL